MLKSLTVIVPAKINLSLDVTGRRPDGYHLLTTIMQTIDLTDQISIEWSTDGYGIILLCDQPDLPLDEKNTAYLAARLWQQATGLTGGVHIELKKKIPHQAGLAGGSADAAGVLFGLNEMSGQALPAADLAELAGRIGADVPFCLTGGTTLCEGIGEIIRPLPPLPVMHVVLIKPDFGLSTPWVFSEYDQVAEPDRIRRPNHAALLPALSDCDWPEAARLTANVLEAVSVSAYPVIGQCKQRLYELGADLAMMSGSGPTVYGLFVSGEACAEALNALQPELPAGFRVYQTMTTGQGPRIML